MKKLGILLLVVALALVGKAQKLNLTVSETEQKVNKIIRPGATIYLELDEKLVKNEWKKQIKDYGKVSTSDGDYYIETASIPGVSTTVRTISKVEKSGKGMMVWMAVDMGGHWVSSGAQGWGAVEKILKDFAIKAYREDIMEQVYDAEKALDKTVKDQDKTIKQGENLQSDLSNNAEEKIRLENALKDNAAQKVQLEKDIETNKKDQQMMASEVEKMRKAVEVVKAKLNNIQ